MSFVRGGAYNVIVLRSNTRVAGEGHVRSTRQEKRRVETVGHSRRIGEYLLSVNGDSGSCV